MGWPTGLGYRTIYSRHDVFCAKKRGTKSLQKKRQKVMGAWCLGVASLMYFLTGVSCIKDKDYSHAIMWICYGIANIALLWYEVEKKK